MLFNAASVVGSAGWLGSMASYRTLTARCSGLCMNLYGKTSVTCSPPCIGHCTLSKEDAPIVSQRDELVLGITRVLARRGRDHGGGRKGTSERIVRPSCLFDRRGQRWTAAASAGCLSPTRTRGVIEPPIASRSDLVPFSKKPGGACLLSRRVRWRSVHASPDAATALVSFIDLCETMVVARGLSSARAVARLSSVLSSSLPGCRDATRKSKVYGERREGRVHH